MRLPINTGFWATPDFGPVGAATYNQLMRSIIEGKGAPIPGAGGFRQITVPVIEPNALHPRRFVVFAVYTQYAVVVLTNSYPVDVDGFILIHVGGADMPVPMDPRKKLTTAQQWRLAERKKLLDAAVRQHFAREHVAIGVRE